MNQIDELLKRREQALDQMIWLSRRLDKVKTDIQDFEAQLKILREAENEKLGKKN